MKKITIAALLLTACITHAAPAQSLMPIRWTADGSQPVAAALSLAQGETRDLICTLKNYGQHVTVPDTATAALYYQTNGMGSLYWSAPATVTSNGIVTATWSPALDAGAPVYNFALGVDDGSTNRIYTAYGIIRLRLSPGHIPNTLPLPRASLDFDAVDILNAPWATPADIDAALDGIVTEETDYIALPVINAHLADADNPHNVTPAQIGAITTNQLDAAIEGIDIEEHDPLAYPVATNALAWLDQLEQYGDVNIVPSPDDWFVFSGGEITGFNYVAGREHVVIPYKIGGIPVTSIGELAFFDVDAVSGKPVVSVIAPKTVTTIDSSAFSSCGLLTTVNLPAATSVDSYAFNSCPNLTSITLGKTPPTTWSAGTVESATIYVPHDAIGYDDTFYGMPVVRATESADNYYLGGKTLEDRFDLKASVADVAAGTNWLYRAGMTGTVAFANAGNRPQAWSGSGNLIVTEISGLASPSQVYWTLQGFSSVTLPAGVYAVGGGTWQTGMVNHFAVWQVAGKTMITFLTATEID